jgi:N-terminal half of MaoC dehydratase
MADRIPIERGKIREFAHATGSTNPAYDRDDATVPPTFLTTAAAFWGSSHPAGELGFELARVLHGEEEFEFFGPPPRAGQTLTFSTRIGEQWEKEGKRGGTMRFAELITDFHDEAGELVAVKRTTMIETGRAPQ